jgi:hypothetical protein
VLLPNLKKLVALRLPTLCSSIDINEIHINKSSKTEKIVAFRLDILCPSIINLLKQEHDQNPGVQKKGTEIMHSFFIFRENTMHDFPFFERKKFIIL